MKFRFLAVGLAAIVLKLFVLGASLAWLRMHHQSPEFCAWDCGYYNEIARQGYRLSPGQHGPLAFFPLFPTVVGFLTSTVSLFFGFVTFEFVAISFNLLSFGFCIALLCAWAKKLGLKHWWLPALLWTSDRFTLWTHVPYTEALFCLLLMFFLLCMRSKSQKVRLLGSALVGGLASGTRIVGLSFVAAQGLSNFGYFLRRPLQGLVVLVLGSLGLLLFFGFVHFEFGSWRMSLETTAQWGRHFSLMGIVTSVKYLLASFYFPTVGLLFLACLGILGRGPKVSAAERIVFLLLALVPLASSVQVSLTRYLSLLVLGYVVFSHYFERFSWIKTKWTMVAVFVLTELLWQVALTVKFLRLEVFQWAA